MLIDQEWVKNRRRQAPPQKQGDPQEASKEKLLFDVDKVASIVLAGGQGTRLFPLTQSRCKPAVCFGGRYRLIDIPLSNSLHSHIHHIFVISQFYASALNEHIFATYSMDLFRNGGIELLTPQQTPEGRKWFQGTADAVRKNLEQLLRYPFEYFLILSGDQLYQLDFTNMLNYAVKSQADLVIASIVVEEQEAHRMGVLKVDAQQRVVSFFEKPQEAKVLQEFALEGGKTWLGSMGIYVFKRAALIELLKCQGDDFGKHLIPKQLKMGKTSAYIFRGYWEDIGTIESYYKASLALIESKNCLNIRDEYFPIYTRPHNLPSPIIKNALVQDSLISQGAVIEAAEVTRSVIGIRADIGKGSIVRGIIIMGSHLYSPGNKECYIGENCLIEKTIFDEQSSAGNRVQLVNKKGLSHFDGDGVYIRDGIIIVASGTHLPDGYIL